jgi:UDP-N-acetylmuramoyl-tripeptide--D-alanyl-D-alanine ligase
LGLSWEEIGQQMQTLQVYPMRFEKIEKEGVIYINDAYNANPESMRAALCSLPSPSPRQKRIAVLGQMVELGRYSEESHREIAELGLASVDLLLCYGKNWLPLRERFYKEGRPAQFFTDFSLLRQHLLESAKPGDLVLLKGSRSNELWRLLD